ncbi:MAG: hypothetical protein ACRD96_03015 [Bryobacteraceae bacterium]
MTPAATRNRDVWQASRLTCLSSVIVVFLTGALAGAVAMNFGAHKWMHRPTPFWTESGKAASLQKWRRELNLTPEQTQQLESILDDFGMYYKNVLGDGRSRILKILNDDQKKKLDKLMLEASR